MRNRIRTGLSLAAAAWIAWAATPARAGVLFFVNDAPGFEAATSDLVPMGSEDWSSAGAAPAAAIADPLLPGVAKGPFPSGVEAATGMTVQGNTLGDSATTPSPGANLFFAPTGFAGLSGNLQASNQLSTNTDGSSFDMIFGGAGAPRPVAVSLSPMFYRTSAPSNSGTVSVRVFDAAGAQLGTSSVPNVIDVSEAAFLGIVATGGDEIGRVNLWAGSAAVPGADNVEVFAAPEAGAATGGTVLAALAIRGALARRVGRRTAGANR